MPDDVYTGLHTLAGFSQLEENPFGTLAGNILLETEKLDNLAGILEAQYGDIDIVAGNVLIEVTKYYSVGGITILEAVDIMRTLAGIISLEVILKDTLAGFVSLERGVIKTFAGKIILEREVWKTLAGLISVHYERKSTFAGNISTKSGEYVVSIASKILLERYIRSTLAGKTILEATVPPTPGGIIDTISCLILLVNRFTAESSKRVSQVLKMAHESTRAASYTRFGGNHVTEVYKILAKYTGTNPYDAAGIAKLIIDIVKDDASQ